MRWFSVVLWMAVACGGGSTTSGPCQTTCDCKDTTTPLSCTGGGEWDCNESQTCEYSCKTSCTGQVYTCASDEKCNGTICSERTTCSP
jgi:hypothetical protein